MNQTREHHHEEKSKRHQAQLAYDKRLEHYLKCIIELDVGPTQMPEEIVQEMEQLEKTITRLRRKIQEAEEAYNAPQGKQSGRKPLGSQKKKNMSRSEKYEQENRQRQIVQHENRLAQLKNNWNEKVYSEAIERAFKSWEERKKFYFGMEEIQTEIPTVEYDGPFNEHAAIRVTHYCQSHRKYNIRQKILEEELKPKIAQLCENTRKEMVQSYERDLCHLYNIISLEDEQELDPDELLRREAIIATTDIKLIALPFGEEKEYTTDDNIEKLTPLTPSDPSFIPSTILRCQTDFLAWKSEYFKVALFGSFSEAEEMQRERAQGAVPVFNLYNSSSAALQQVIHYMYTNSCQVTGEIAAELLFHSLRFEIPGITALAEEYIIENSHDFDGVDVLMMADLISSEKMNMAARRQIVSSCKRAMKTGETYEDVVNKLNAAEIPEHDLVDILYKLRS